MLPFQYVASENRQPANHQEEPEAAKAPEAAEVAEAFVLLNVAEGVGSLKLALARTCRTLAEKSHEVRRTQGFTPAEQTTRRCGSPSRCRSS